MPERRSIPSAVGIGAPSLVEAEVMATIIARPAQQRLRGQILDRVQRLTSRLATNAGPDRAGRHPQSSP